MAPIVIYTKGWCPYCSAAKDLLAKKGAAFTEIDVERSPGARPEMVKKAGGRSTVPADLRRRAPSRRLRRSLRP